MDALEFIRERNRMCNSFGHNSCGNCPANKHGECIITLWDEEIVPIVEKWSKENPIKTRQSEFLKLFPEAYVGGDGCLALNPCEFYPNMRKECTNKYNWCSDCRHKFWMQEIE